jgi:hypothetical protein
MPLTTSGLKKTWSDRLQPLVGRSIARVRYMDDEERREFGWSCSAIVLQLDDGTLLIPQADDEGNGAGALFIMPSPDARKRGVPDGAPVI